MKLTTTSGGNISLKLRDGRILITPSLIDKGRLKADDIAVLDENWNNLTPRIKITSEYPMHKQTMRERDDINVILHAHPLYASLCSATNIEINTRLTAESYYMIKKIGFAPYKIMGSVELGDIVSITLKDCNVALMENHGVICISTSLTKAFDLLELTENAAKMSVLIQNLKANDKFEVRELDEKRLKEIREL